MITLTDPTMAGTKDPEKKRKRMEEHIKNLKEEIAMREDQIWIMRSELDGVRP
jgi:SMC interacting uncharacterized protein involved in chromosome segregation